MYADTITDSMKAAIEETNRRREYQIAYNKKHNITPKTIKKDIVNTLMISRKIKDADRKKLSRGEIIKEIERLTGLMSVASHNLDFETCIQLRDEIMRLKKEIRQ